MKFHGIEMQGTLILEMRSLPSWTGSDEGRLVYDTSNNALYVGGDTDWVRMADEDILSTHTAATGTSVHGLGTMSTQNSTAVSITGGTLSAMTGVGITDGSVGSPSFKFSSDADTGIYRIGSNNLGFACAGARRMDYTASGLLLEIGTRVNEFSIDGTLAGNSDNALPTEKAVKTFVDAYLHNDLESLTTGDPHTQYPYLNGRSGGQILYGGTAASNNLQLHSTTNGTKGRIFLGSNSAYDGANNRLGVNTTSPSYTLDVNGTFRLQSGQEVDLISTQTDLDDGGGSSDYMLSTQKAIKTYVDTGVASAIIVPDVLPGSSSEVIHYFPWRQSCNATVATTMSEVITGREGTVQIYLEMRKHTSGGNDVTLGIYVNDILQTQWSQNGSTWVSRSYQITGLSPYDKIQIKTTSDGSDDYALDFREYKICMDNPVTDTWIEPIENTYHRGNGSENYLASTYTASIEDYTELYEDRPKEIALGTGLTFQPIAHVYPTRGGSLMIECNYQEASNYSGYAAIYIQHNGIQHLPIDGGYSVDGTTPITRKFIVNNIKPYDPIYIYAGHSGSSGCKCRLNWYKVLCQNPSSGKYGMSNLGFAEGTKMMFAQATAPVGWTRDESYSIGGGYRSITLASNGGPAGATGGGNDPILGNLTHQHTTAAHTLTESEMPKHYHDIRDGSGGDHTNTVVNSGFSGQDSQGSWVAGTNHIEATGGSGAHEHGATGWTSPDISLKYLLVLVAKKNYGTMGSSSSYFV